MSASTTTTQAPVARAPMVAAPGAQDHSAVANNMPQQVEPSFTALRSKKPEYR